MQCRSTQECHKTILEYASQGPQGLARLREILPVLFDYHRILTREARASLLRTCALTPVLCRNGQVTFAMDSPSAEEAGPPSIS